jgi:hypothetical protein
VEWSNSVIGRLAYFDERALPARSVFALDNDEHPCRNPSFEQASDLRAVRLARGVEFQD